MANIKDMSRITDKWKRASAAATQDYQQGVEQSQIDWAAVTAAAEPAYKTGVTAAMGRGAFGKGVRAAGTAKWKSRTIAIGPGRWASGIAASEDLYAKAFEPYRQVIAALNLPARAEKGNPSNIQRVAVIAKALHDKKTQIGA